MPITDHAKARYTTKKFDPSQRIDEATIEQLLSLLHNCPSSINSQPWHFILAASEQAKERVAKATEGPYAGNHQKVLDASHVLFLCARTSFDDAHLDGVLEQERRDGRIADDAALAATRKGRAFYLNLHRYALKDLQHWMEKQVYIALGFTLLGAATLGVDACPIEGFDPRILDTEFDLHTQGLTSVVMVALGYRAADDANATLPKSRLPVETLITRL